MAWTHHLREQMQLRTPHTHRAMTDLVLAFEYAAKNMGKRTWYGADKSPEAYHKLGAGMRDTVIAMLADSLISVDTPTDAVFERMKSALSQFKEAYPNWPLAYSFAYRFFLLEPELATATIEYVKSRVPR